MKSNKKAPPMVPDLKRPHRCEVCDHRFRRPAELKRHHATHSNKKDFKCEYCDKAYAHNRGLLHHIARDHRKLRYKCPICYSAFTSTQNMNRHIFAVHPIDNEKSSEFSCSFCECRFQGMGALSIHLKFQHNAELPEERRKRYPCSQCLKIFKTKRDWKEHQSHHAGERGHKCPRCGVKLISRAGLKIHMATHIRNEINQISDPTLVGYKCMVCFKMLSSAQALHRHQVIHQKFQCSRCYVTLPSAVRLRWHESECVAGGDSETTRDLMQIGETQSVRGGWRENEEDEVHTRPASEGYLRQHISRYPCRVCNAVFDSFASLQSHARMHNGRASKPHICWMCHKSFSSITQLQSHRSVHDRDRPQMCPICPRSFVNKTRWLQHMRENHPDARRPLTNEQRAIASASVQSFRNITGRELAEGLFRNRAHSVDHLAPPTTVVPRQIAEEGAEITVLESGRIPGAPVSISGKLSNVVRCSVCKHAYHSIQYLMKHLQQSNTDSMHACAIYPCSMCGTTVNGCTNMALHLRGHGVYEPPVGGATYATEGVDVGNASNHGRQKNKRETMMDAKTLLTPGSEKVYVVPKTMTIFSCRHCEKTFSKKSDVERHYRVHTGVKPFRCDICHRGFASKPNLKVHREIHERDAEKQFKCTVCEKEFYSNSALKLHLRVHTGEKPFKCPFKDCDQTFRTSSDCKNHIKWHDRGCPLKIKVDPTAIGEMTSSHSNTVSSAVEGLQRTIKQISTMNNAQPLKVHAGSAFGRPLRDKEISRLCINVFYDLNGMAKIVVNSQHIDPLPEMSTPIHFCVIMDEFYRIVSNTPPHTTMSFIAGETTVFMYPHSVISYFANSTTSIIVHCDPHNPTTVSNQYVWVLPTEHSTQNVNSQWTPACEVCEMQFRSAAESEHHFVSEDHETAMLMCDTVKRSHVSSSIVSEGEADAVQQNIPSSSSGFCCHICGVKYFDMDLLVSHIRRVHEGSQTESMSTVRPAARTAPIH